MPRVLRPRSHLPRLQDIFEVFPADDGEDPQARERRAEHDLVRSLATEDRTKRQRLDDASAFKRRRQAVDRGETLMFRQQTGQVSAPNPSMPGSSSPPTTSSSATASSSAPPTTSSAAASSSAPPTTSSTAAGSTTPSGAARAATSTRSPARVIKFRIKAKRPDPRNPRGGIRREDEPLPQQRRQRQPAEQAEQEGSRAEQREGTS